MQRKAVLSCVQKIRFCLLEGSLKPVDLHCLSSITSKTFDRFSKFIGCIKTGVTRAQRMNNCICPGISRAFKKFKEYTVIQTYKISKLKI